MKILNESIQPGPGILRAEEDQKYQEAVKKGYFNPRTRKWDREKLEADGMLQGQEKPIEEPTKEPIEEPTKQPTKQPTQEPIRNPLPTEPVKDVQPTEPVVDTKEVGELTEQIQRMKKLMGM